MIALGSVLPPARPPPPPPHPPPVLEAVEVVEGMSEAVTSTAPPCDSRNAITAQTCSGESCFVIPGMIGWQPGPPYAGGLSRDSRRYCLKPFPRAGWPH